MSVVCSEIEPNTITLVEGNKNTNLSTIREKKNLVKAIEGLSKVEHIEIFKLFKKKNVNYTENSNGIFINFTALEDDIIKQLDKFVNFCLKNRNYLKLNETIINKK